MKENLFMELTEDEMNVTDGGNALVDALIKAGAWIASHPEFFLVAV